MTILRTMAERAAQYLEMRRDKVRSHRLQYAAFKDSLPMRDPRLTELCATYNPTLTQADLDRQPQDRPGPTSDLLRAEMLRIRDYLEPLTSDWPLDTTDRVLQALMQKVWREMQERLHMRVFGSLELPRFYRVYHGFCSYEATHLRRDQFGQMQHVGVQSGYTYGTRMPILWEHLT